MLIEFSVGNFLSFKAPVTFSMIAAPIKEHEDRNVCSATTLRLVKSAVLYGANASGKSNLLKAMNFMRWLIFNSSKETQATETIGIECFRLSTETEKAPSFFEITFICEQQRYRYGLEIDKNQVHSEWLFFVPSRQEAKLFVREGDKISLGRYFKEGKGVQEKTRPNALFLSVVAQFNGKIATKILKWFRSFNIISGLDDKSFMNFTLDQLANEEFKALFLKCLRIADFDISDVAVEKVNLRISDLPENLKISLTKEGVDEIEGMKTSILHRKYDENHQIASFEELDLNIHESEGTKKFFGLLGPLLDTLNHGQILIIDELDARLHPLITRFIITVFHSRQSNPQNAQLVFATHDTNLLSNELFRRDQIWFTEKDEYGATDLYSLVEYKRSDKKIRNDASYEKDYILGKYGAIPFIGNFETLIGMKHE